MASRSPAGGAGAPPASANIVNSGRSIYGPDDNLLEQYAVTFEVINEIYRNLSDIEMSKELLRYGPNKVRFYLKGGNSMPFLELKYPVNTTPPIPSPFPSDFDFNLAVDPFLDISEYNYLLENSIDIILTSITGVIQKNFYKVKLPLSELEQCIKVHDYGAFIPPVHETLEGLIDKASTHKAFECPKTCPFSIYVYKNVTIKHIPTNMGLITLKYKLPTGKSIKLLDIAYFMRSPHKKIPTTIAVDKKLRLDWEITGLVHYEFTTPMNLTINVYDPLTAYINQKIAFNANTRSNKRNKRSARMTRLKNMLTKTHRNGNARNTRKRSIRTRYPEFANILTNNI